MELKVQNFWWDWFGDSLKRQDRKWSSKRNCFFFVPLVDKRALKHNCSPMVTAISHLVDASRCAKVFFKINFPRKIEWLLQFEIDFLLPNKLSCHAISRPKSNKKFAACCYSYTFIVWKQNFIICSAVLAIHIHVCHLIFPSLQSLKTFSILIYSFNICLCWNSKIGLHVW